MNLSTCAGAVNSVVPAKRSDVILNRQKTIINALVEVSDRVRIIRNKISGCPPEDPCKCNECVPDGFLQILSFSQDNVDQIIGGLSETLADIERDI